MLLQKKSKKYSKSNKKMIGSINFHKMSNSIKQKVINFIQQRKNSFRKQKTKFFLGRTFK